MPIRTAAPLALVVALSVSSASAAETRKPKPVDLGKGVTSPEPGVVCDKKASFCADFMGISMAYTEMYLGKKAQDRPEDLLQAQGERHGRQEDDARPLPSGEVSR